MDGEFEIQIQANLLDQYRDILREIPKVEKEINGLLKQQEKVPIVKDKVKASLNEFPFTETHVTVDAPDPILNTHIEKLLIKKRALLKFLMEERLAVEDFIQSIDDSRTRQIFDAVFVKGRSQQSIATELGLDQSWISRLIEKEIHKRT